MPPAMSNVPSEKRELGLQRKVQMREINPFLERGSPVLLIFQPAHNRGAKRYHWAITEKARICAV